MRTPLVIYHYPCDDGFGAAWIINKALNGAVEFHPGIYGKPPPDVTDRDVILVDFSYKKDVLEEMKKVAGTILILDHHKTAEEDLADWPKLDPTTTLNEFAAMANPENRFFALFDMTRSGAGIAWDFFNPGQPRPLFVEYLEDRDLWKKKLGYGDEFTIALRSYPYDFATWDKLGVEPLIHMGIPLQRYFRARVEEIKLSGYVAQLGQWKCRIANATKFVCSEVAGEMPLIS